LKKESSRHHYIPEFLIKGFTNSNNKIYVYDKEKDEIQAKLKSPKSIFFEWDRNTFLRDDGIELSVIEDVLYKEWDNRSAILIRKMQNNNLPDISLLSDDNIANFILFTIQLFWRIPYTDFAVEHLLDNAEINVENVQKLKQYQPFQKQQRTLLYKETLKEIKNIERKKKGFYTKIFELEKDIFVIGDNPTVYQKRPSTFDHLFDLDNMIAVSSRRIITNSLKEFEFFGFSRAIEYNYFVISQSKRYICSSDRKVLEESVKYYKKAKNLFIDFELKKKLFTNE
jgi:hypothetical protein